MHNNVEFQFQYTEPHQSLGAPTKSTSVPVDPKLTETQLSRSDPNLPDKKKSLNEMEGKTIVWDPGGWVTKIVKHV